MIGLSLNRKKKYMTIKYYTWFMKSRGKVDTVRGVDEHEGFKPRKWKDQKGDDCYNFWDPDAQHPRTAVNYTVRKA